MVWLAFLAAAVLPAHDPPAHLRELDASIAQHPDDPALYFARGEVLLHIEQAGRALADFERAAALRADFPHLDLARGHALRALGRHDEATTAAARELVRDPACAAAAVLHARSLAALGRREAALHAWDRALALVSRAPPDLYLERADAALRLAAVREAIAGLDRAMQAVGAVIALQERAVALCEHGGRYDEAVARLDRILRQVQRPESWLAWKARLLDRLGQPAAAAAARQSALLAIAALPAARRDAPRTRELAQGLARAVRAAPLVPPLAPCMHRDAVPEPAVSPPPPAPPAPGPGVVLVPRGALWRYADGGADLGTAWRSPGYDDTLWGTGLAQLGFGDGDEMSLVNGGPVGSRTPTIYFRRPFTVADPSAFTLAHIELLRDDGVVVYLNGTELTRSNMASGAIGFNSLALQAVNGQAERDFTPIAFAPTLLLPGSNVLAVEVHQSSSTSDDLSFDLELVATPRLSVARGPYLQLASPTAATVRWRTDAPSGSGVWLGSSPGALTLASSSAVLRTEHEVRLTGLSPSTRYYYAVGNGTQQLAGATANHWFETSPLASTAVPTRVWVLGDSGTADASARAVRDAYLAYTGTRRTDVLLMLGDNAYWSGTDEEYQRAVFDTYPDTLRNTFVWPALGNHDAVTARSGTGTGPYYDIFSLPTQGEAGGLPSASEAYYAFDHGRIHFVCLDSQDSDRSPTGAMVTWLDADLRDCTAEWVVVFFHHPTYSKGSHDSDNPIDSGGRMQQMRENVLPVLERNGVDLVLAGHSHSYERSFLLDGHYGVSSTLTPQMKLDRGDGREEGDGAYSKAHAGLTPREGAVYAVAGSSGSTGGGSLDHPANFVSFNELGSMVLDVDGRRLDARFLDRNGTVRDHFTLRKGEQRWLTRDEPAISVATGGTQILTLAAGPTHANRSYVVAGSFGTSPGFMLGSVQVPLNPDGWLTASLQLANGVNLQNTVGSLNGAGNAQARIVFPPLHPSLAGTVMYHAFVVFAAGQAVGASNAVKLRLVP